jgi:hypothetical protein
MAHAHTPKHKFFFEVSNALLVCAIAGLEEVVQLPSKNLPGIA